MGAGTMLPHAFKLRTITHFLPERLEWQNPVQLAANIQNVVSTLNTQKAAFESKGYEVQTLRLATRLLQQASGPEEAAAAAVAAERACLAAGLSFLSLGSTGAAGPAFVALPGSISDLAASLTHTSFTVAWLPGWGALEARALAAEIFRAAELTNGAANFRLAVSFGCQDRGIPYFPAAEAPAGRGPCFAIGTENSGLLHAAFSAAQDAADTAGTDALAAAGEELQRVLESALAPVESIALELEAAGGGAYLGIDTSIAPALEPPTIPAAFEALGIGSFGGAGTLAVTERVTRALQGVSLRRTGYCGLMLPVCEDEGLAAAASAGNISVQSLLMLSAVCGVGLDTVPVPGPGPETPPEEREKLINAAAAVILDVAALSGRLGGKPLTARLLPVPGGTAGEKTAYNNPYLVESALMAL